MIHVETSPRLDAVQSFLAESPQGLFIGGRWQSGRNPKLIPSIDPGSGEILTHFADATLEEVDEAVAAADRAFQRSGWAGMSPTERGAYLHRMADLVEKHAAEIAEIESLDVGKPLVQAQSDVANFPATLRYYSDLAVTANYGEPIALSTHEARLLRRPYGVCAFILPWNFPFLLAGWNLSPALAAGNTVVIKPAEDTPLSTLYLARLVKEAAIPEGVVNVVTGYGETAGACLARHPGISRMGFTGSPEVGRLVAEACGRNLAGVKLELGGKGAAVVFDDVDIDRTADALVRAVTLNSGQVCCTATRWVVHERVYKPFVERALERLAAVRVGYGRDPETQMGPLVSGKQLERVLDYVRRGREEGAEVLMEGRPIRVRGFEGGFYMRPAALAGPPENVAAREEIFGPVPYLLKFSSEAEAVSLVNRSPYGLANSVWTQDPARANRMAEALVAGNSWINAHNVFVHGLPYCGIKLSGMGGGVLGPDTLFDYLRQQSIVRPL